MMFRGINVVLLQPSPAALVSCRHRIARRPAGSTVLEWARRPAGSAVLEWAGSKDDHRVHSPLAALNAGDNVESHNLEAFLQASGGREVSIL